jgi:hypothetical protein
MPDSKQLSHQMNATAMRLALHSTAAHALNRLLASEDSRQLVSHCRFHPYVEHLPAVALTELTLRSMAIQELDRPLASEDSRR